MADNKITATQSFDVPSDKIFQAWTEFEHLKKWWKPLGKTMTKLDQTQGEQDVSYHFSDGNEEGSDLVIKSEFDTVKENEHLVYSWNWYMDEAPVKDGLYKLDVKFEDADNGSKITVTQQNESDEEGVHPHAMGWEDALQDLKAFVEQKD